MDKKLKLGYNKRMLNSKPLLSSKKIRYKIRKRIKKKIELNQIHPCLAIILVGKNADSKIYVQLKIRIAEKIKIKTQFYSFSANAKKEKIIELIKKLNKNPKIHGILVQLPLPKKFNPDFILQTINVQKDVDGLLKDSPFISPVPQAVWELIKLANQINAVKQSKKKNLKIRLKKEKKLKNKPNKSNKSAVIICKNKFFGESLAEFLSKKQIKSQICLLNSQELKSFKKFSISSQAKTIINADLVIIAIGQPYWLKPKLVKKNCIIIDIGYTRKDKKSFGDVDPMVFQKTPYLSPVPGGVGPLTVIFLLKNTIQACLKTK